MKKFLLFVVVAGVFFIAGVVVARLELPPYQQLTAVKQALPFISRLAVLIKHWNGDNAPVGVIMLGDSLTSAGDWPQLLGTRDVLNFGEDGDTTNGVIHRLYRVTAHKPRLVFLMIGVNDLLGDTPPDITERNIQLIASRLAKDGIKPIVQSTLFIANGRAKELNPLIEALDEHLKAWCAQNNIDFLDLNPVLSADGLLRPDVTFDGEHVNARGYQLWSARVRQVIGEKLPAR